MNPAPPEQDSAAPMSLDRARRWIAVAIGLGVLGYAGYAVLKDFDAVGAELASFDWPIYAVVLGLTTVNYGLRYAKWHYLLGQLGVRISHRVNLPIFVAGLAMVITPGKLGELLKPWLVREATGAPMVRTVPALVGERLTDGIAVVSLAALGVSTYYAEGAQIVGFTVVLIVGGLAVLASRTLSERIIDLVGVLPLVGGLAPRLHEMYDALRTALSPVPLLITVVLSLIAWWAECVGYYLVLGGVGATATLDSSTFLYAFATVFGAPSPGGAGLTDAALTEVPARIVVGLTPQAAMAAAILIRVATLWYGVIVGAIVLMFLNPKHDNQG